VCVCVHVRMCAHSYTLDHFIYVCGCRMHIYIYVCVCVCVFTCMCLSDRGSFFQIPMSIHMSLCSGIVGMQLLMTYVLILLK